MLKKSIGLAAVVLLSIFLVTGAYAQVVDAVGTLSTEARYSAGLFTSDVDNFISVTDYNPEIGTFFFMGGYPSEQIANPDYDATKEAAAGDPTDPNYDPTYDPKTPEYIDGPISGTDNTNFGGPNRINFGFGKTLANNNYLAIYYGGKIVNASGHRDKLGVEHDKDGNPDPSKPNDSVNSNASADWEDSIAVLFALGKNMAFRLDLNLPADLHSEKEVADGLFASSETTVAGGSGIGLTFGLPGERGALSNIYASIGYLFGNVDITDIYEKDKKITKYPVYSSSVIGLAGGAGFGDFYADLGVNFALPGSAKTADPDDPTKTIGSSSGGGFDIGLELSYYAGLELGKVEMQFRPYLGLGYVHESHNSKYGKDDTIKRLGEDEFGIYTGLDLGLKFQATKKVALYTGASLDILSFTTAWQSGGLKDPSDKEIAEGHDKKSTSSDWEINGIQWDPNRFDTGTGTDSLSLGLTWTPVENCVIGFGLKTLVEKLFTVNLQDMKVEAGTFWTDAGQANIGSWAGSLFDGLQFDLTVSFSFGGSGSSSSSSSSASSAPAASYDSDEE